MISIFRCSLHTQSYHILMNGHAVCLLSVLRALLYQKLGYSKKFRYFVSKVLESLIIPQMSCFSRFSMYLHQRELNDSPREEHLRDLKGMAGGWCLFWRCFLAFMTSPAAHGDMLRVASCLHKIFCTARVVLSPSNKLASVIFLHCHLKAQNLRCTI